MKKIAIVLIVLMAMLGTTVVIFHGMLHNSITTTNKMQQTSTYTITSTTSTVTKAKGKPIASPPFVLSGFYLLNGSNNTVYLVFHKSITKVIIFNQTFVRGPPISTFNGILVLQNVTVYSQLEKTGEVTIQVYNGTGWQIVTLPVYYTSQQMQPYAWLYPEEPGTVYPF